ncbi:MAG: SDR family oxidoreductase [Actinomycetes bacterium]
MDIRIDGKVAVVTGGSRGIGRAIAAALAASGASVMLVSRKRDQLERTAEAIRSETGGSIEFHVANAGDPDLAEQCVAETVERFGSVDILVNNAATNPYFGPTMEIGIEQFDKTVAVNWRGALVWSQQVWRAWMADHGGVILNIASVGGFSVEPSIGIYNGTKAALMHLTRQLALELSPSVRVNGIAPGLVKTDMARALWEPNEAAIARRMPAGRLGEPDDIANAAVFLCSDASSWITGTTMVIDGGLLLQG